MTRPPTVAALTRRAPPWLGDQLGRGASGRLLVEVDVGQRLPVGADAARTGGAPMLMTVEEM
jgi:hypothetical protein